ncbi:arf-GAP domain and FG repeat-containing protein 1a [Aplochiton taeniatus]
MVARLRPPEKIKGRGLNPPHRVKSISMTTFTQQEIEFLQKHGNEVCKPIWLGLYDDRTTSIPDFREPQKVKEFLQEKYEKKRWYVPLEQAKTVASAQATISGSSASSTSSTPEVRPLKTLLGESVPTLHLNKHTPSQSPVGSRAQAHLHQKQQQQHDRRFDLLSDLGGDIFAPPPSNNASSANFANFAHFNSHPASQNTNTDFANFDAFGSAGASGVFAPPAPQAASQLPIPGGSLPGGGSSVQASAGIAGPPPSQSVGAGGDRYAALAELDNVFGSSTPPTSTYNSVSTAQGSMFGPVTGVSSALPQQALPSMAQGFGAPTNPFAAAVAAPATAPTNPFQSNGRAAAVAAAASFGTGSMSMPSGFGNAAVYNFPTSFSGTFQQPFPGQVPLPQPPAYSHQPNGGGFASYGQTKQVMAPFGQPMTAPGMSSNPFLAGGPSGQFTTANSSTNPFL